MSETNVIAGWLAPSLSHLYGLEIGGAVEAADGVQLSVDDGEADARAP